MSFDDLKYAATFAVGLTACIPANRAEPAYAPEGDFSPYHDHVRRQQEQECIAERESTTVIYDDNHRPKTVFVHEIPVEVPRGVVPNDAFHLQGTVDFASGLNVNNDTFNAFEHRLESQLRFVPELQLGPVAANAVIGIAQTDLEHGQVVVEGVEAVHLRYNIVGGDLALYNMLSPRLDEQGNRLDPDHNLRIAAEIKMLPGAELPDGNLSTPAFLPGGSAKVHLGDGPLGTEVFLEGGAYLNLNQMEVQQANAHIGMGWYVLPSSSSVQVDIEAYAGGGVEALPPTSIDPQAWEDRAAGTLDFGVRVTPRLGTPTPKKAPGHKPSDYCR